MEEQRVKPQEGDYCRRNFCILQKIKEEIAPCNICDVRCPHSAVKEEKDYLVKEKRNDGKETTKTH